MKESKLFRVVEGRLDVLEEGRIDRLAASGGAFAHFFTDGDQLGVALFSKRLPGHNSGVVPSEAELRIRGVATKRFDNLFAILTGVEENVAFLDDVVLLGEKNDGGMFFQGEGSFETRASWGKGGDLRRGERRVLQSP